MQQMFPPVNKLSDISLGILCLGLICLLSLDYLVWDYFLRKYFAIWDCIVRDCFVRTRLTPAYQPNIPFDSQEREYSFTTNSNFYTYIIEITNVKKLENSRFSTCNGYK